MKRIVIAPDSFKGTLEAREVCNIIAGEAKKLCPEAEILCIPMSDGGEGMCASYLSLIGGERRSLTVTGPKGGPVEAEYCILPDGSAVAEMAACAGLPLMGGELEPLTATTYGVGELIEHIAALGCGKLLLGLGGSATNDCGIGMAAALGYRFLDADGGDIAPMAGNLWKVEKILPPEHRPELQVRAACDVDNPLCGERGAAAVFGPQKGLKPEQIVPHDGAMAHFARVIERDLGKDVAEVPGAGAAGGLGAGVLAFLDGELTPGIELLLDSVGFDEMLDTAELVITGEGRLDGQSMAGKVPVGVSRRAKAKGVPCIALAGCLGKGAELCLNEGISAYYACGPEGRDMEQLRACCRRELAELAAKVLPEYM